MEVTYDPCTVVITPAADVTPEQLRGIDGAIAIWNDAAGLRLVRASGEIDAGAEALPIRFEAAAAAFRGVYLDEEGVVLVNSRIEDDGARAITIAHELGHAFGLWHVDPDEAASLMNPGNLEIFPTPADVAAVRALWGTCDAAATAPSVP